MSDFLTEHYLGAQRLTDASYELNSMSKAAYALGLLELGDKLTDISGDIRQATDRMRDAVSKDINDKFKVSQQSAQDAVKTLIDRGLSHE